VNARAGIVDRVVWALLAAGATAVLVTARVLTPDPIRGSSAQLGLPPCGFQAFTGYRCPGCGLTTCFAYTSRLDLVGAWHANAFGILLFGATALFVPFAIACAWRGERVTATLERIQAERIAIALALLGLAYWVVRLGIEIAAR
jgi:hypothetical protein